jgi:hypothetical protein
MIVHLVANLITTLVAILNPILPVLDSVGSIACQGAVANVGAIPRARPITCARPVTKDRPVTGNRTVSHAGTVTHARTLARGGQSRWPGIGVVQEIRRCSPCAGAWQAARSGRGKGTGTSRHARRLDVEEIL